MHVLLVASQGSGSEAKECGMAALLFVHTDTSSTLGRCQRSFAKSRKTTSHSSHCDIHFIKIISVHQQYKEAQNIWSADEYGNRESWLSVQSKLMTEVATKLFRFSGLNLHTRLNSQACFWSATLR